MKNMNLPQGFDKHPSTDTVRYRASQNKPGNAPTVNFRGRPGGGPGGPGGRMAQTVEKPADAKKTLARLLQYFKKAKKLLPIRVTPLLAH